MKSKRNVSFISWNTTNFLVNKLEQMRISRILQYYMVIFHFKEDDDLSDHHHVILFPAKSIDYFDIQAELTEPQPYGQLPLGISMQPFYEDKYGHYHWILYVLHDKDYIRSKYKEEKKYTYEKENFITPDIRTCYNLVREAYTMTDFHKDKVINELLSDGVKPHELVKNGYIPIKEACAYHHYFQMAGYTE